MVKILLLAVSISIVYTGCYGTSGDGNKGKPREPFKNDVDLALKAANDAAGEDKIVSRDEFKKFKNDNYLKQRPNSAPLTDSYIDGLFNLFDTDQNNQLTIPEVLYGFLQYQEFKYYDQNLDNILTPEELMNAFDTPDIKKNADGTFVKGSDGKYEYEGASKTVSYLEYIHRIATLSKLDKDWVDTLGKKLFESTTK